MITRAWLTVLAILLAVSACGAKDDSSAETPKPSSVTSTAPAVQPTGAYGVTYEIQNWAEYAEDPAVLAWKKIEEAANSTINNEKLPDFLKGRVPAETLKNLKQNLANAKGRGFYTQEVAKVRIESAETTGDKAVLVVCGWIPSTDLYQKDGTLVGATDNDEEWRRNRVTMNSGPDGWVVTSSKEDGRCPGAAPR